MESQMPGDTIDFKPGTDHDVFLPVMLVFGLLFGYAGVYLKMHNPPPVSIVDSMLNAAPTHFIFDEEKPVPKVVPLPKVEKKEITPQEEPIDLTEKPLMAQKTDDIVEKPPENQEQKPVRRIYGLKRVYSMGIGASGDASSAIIGKLGNTLSADIDTIKATDSDLIGTPVSITTVTSYPKLKNIVKPEYTKEMIEHQVEGVVRVKVVVDVDGRVKKVVVLDDLGFGSKTMVAEACFKMEFEPAMVDVTPVCTAIMMRIRFEMLGS